MAAFYNAEVMAYSYIDVIRDGVCYSDEIAVNCCDVKPMGMGLKFYMGLTALGATWAGLTWRMVK